MLELWHFRPDCDIPGCYRCLWWDVAYWIDGDTTMARHFEMRGLMP